MNHSPLWQRLIFLALLLATLGSCWWLRGRLLERYRLANAGLQTELVALQEQLTAARQQLDELKASLAVTQEARREATVHAAQSQRETALADAGDLWIAPPKHLPAWMPESPYVWLRKDILPSFPFRPFGGNGALDPSFGSLLVAEPEQVTALNRKLTGLIHDYQALEVARAAPTDDHPPGTGGAGGNTLTIRVPPLAEEAARLKHDFETTLRIGLGEQRAVLVLQAASDWFDSQFSKDGSLPKTYSVVRHPDGSFNVVVGAGGSWLSVGELDSFEEFIPAHLQSIFAALKADAADSMEGKPNP